MRTLVDIPETDLLALADLCAATNRPRAALIREAIADYVQRHRKPAVESAFGLWESAGEDGVTYQRRMRDEW